MSLFSSSGSFNNLERFLKKMRKGDIFEQLDRYAREGVSALSNATPIDSGATATSWDYEVYKTRGSYTITWTNSNINDGVAVAVLIQYGHGTGTGGYVTGFDYINPAMRPVFEQIAEKAWKAVTSA